jgi:type II secretory pathway component PulM
VKVTARERRVIAVGAVLALGVLVYYALGRLPDSEDLSQAVDLKKKMLLKQRETLAREETYKSRLEQYRKLLEQDKTHLLPGDNPNVAGAELQKILTDFADQSSVEITQKNILPSKRSEDGIQKISVRIDTTCAAEQLVQFMAAIENYEKFLTIDELTVTGIRGVQKKYEIRPSLTVSGYIGSRESTPDEHPEAGS